MSSSIAKTDFEKLLPDLEKPKAGPGVVHLEIVEPLDKKEEELHGQESLNKSVINVLNGAGTIERLAFETDPDINVEYQQIYIPKTRLLSDDILKRITIQDDLTAAICGARSNQLSSFGRPQPDRFSTGFRIEPEPGLMDSLTPEQKKALQSRISQAEARLLTCGSTQNYRDDDAVGFSQFLFMAVRDAITFGRIAVEIIRTGTSPETKKFHSFRLVDGGTVYKAAPQKGQLESIRKEAFNTLQRIKNKRLVPEKFMNDEYSWVQVIHHRPRQAFTSEECLVHNFFPSTHVELNGYPITPLDTVISAVLTHINITTHNKLYFQHGRAAKGMMVIKSDDATPKVIGKIRQQFNASINAVQNSWRMPVFGIGQKDAVDWMPIDNSSRDMEFQYLSDSNCRTILSAFQMSPDELPGYSHLSRGTNTQALSESNNEYRLTAHRDVGFRPLLANFQNFINSRIFPLIDPELARIASFKFVGLDAETSEKEAARLGAEVNIHLTMDDILEKVEKKPLGADLGGKFPLNPSWQNAVMPYLHVGDIREKIFGIKGAAQDPEFQYVRDEFWFKWQDMRMQLQQAQAQAAAPQPAPGGPAQDQQGSAEDQNAQNAQQQDIGGGLDQAKELLSKKEITLSAPQKKLLKEQQKIIDHFLDGWNKDAEEAKKDILAAIKKK